MTEEELEASGVLSQCNDPSCLICTLSAITVELLLEDDEA